MSMRIEMKTEIGPFDGTPTAEELRTALEALPEHAFVRVETWDSQLEGSGWRLKASWVEER